MLLYLHVYKSHCGSGLNKEQCACGMDSVCNNAYACKSCCYVPIVLSIIATRLLQGRQEAHSSTSTSSAYNYKHM